MKRILLTLSIVAMSAMCFAYELSANGRSHFKAAMSLLEMASSVDDYKQVAQELETVKQSDPNHPETYLKLCKIYGRIGVEEGDSYFSKAQQALNEYHTLVPNDIDTYNEEKVLLDALKKKYQNNNQNKLTGTWKRLNCGDWCAFFPTSITISEDSQNQDYIVRFASSGNSNIRYPNYFTMPRYENTVSFVNNTEYGKYTIGNGSITDHDILVWHQDGSCGTNGGVTGYYNAYSSSKVATKECWTFYYRIQKINNTLYVYFKGAEEYYDQYGNKIFYQGRDIEELVKYTK